MPLEFKVDMIIYLIILIISLIFVLFLPKYRDNLFYIARNILKAYKNFFHWNLSKILIWIYSRILWIIINIPFAVIIITIIYSISSSIKPELINKLFIENKIDYSLVILFLNNPLAIISIIVLFFIMLYLFIFAMMYWELLQQNIFISYLKWEKLGLFKNYYLNFKLIYKFLKLFSIEIGLILLPIIVAWIYILLILIGWYIIPTLRELVMSQNIYFAIINILILIGFIIVTINIILRLTMTNYILLNSSKFDEKPSKFIKKSFEITRGELLKIIALGIPFLAISLIMWSIIDYIFIKYIQIDYIQYIFNYIFFGWIIRMFFISIYQILLKDINLNK